MAILNRVNRNLLAGYESIVFRERFCKIGNYDTFLYNKHLRAVLISSVFIEGLIVMGKILFFLKKRREFCRFECRKSFPIFIPNVSHSSFLSFCTDSSHQTHLSALIVNNIPHAHLKRRARLTEASHDFVSHPHFHRAKNVFHATTNFTFLRLFSFCSSVNGGFRLAFRKFAECHRVPAAPL
jgi:hypothetical protein